MRTLIALLLLAGQLLANSYSTNFPAGEMGHWVQGKTNGLDWCNVANTPGFAFGTQVGAAPYDDSTAVLPGTWGNDQTAQGVVATPSIPQGSVSEVELRLRTTINPHSITGYEFNASISPSAGSYVEIVRWNGPLGSFTGLAGANVQVRSGDVLLAEAVGSRLTWSVNGRALCAVNDSMFPSGSPGVGMYTNTDKNTYGFSSFSATDNGSATPSPTPAPTPQPYEVWEASLISEMRSVGVTQNRINAISVWLKNNPPTP